jgi:squalene-hopene/tetraprenyl-beta-curcumene cyclase
MDFVEAGAGPGDWQVKNKDAEPGGWVFEFRNDFYPDVDDTAFVLMALQRVKYRTRCGWKPRCGRDSVAVEHAESRRRLGAFDRDNDKKFLCNIPFADHNAMIDLRRRRDRACWNAWAATDGPRSIRRFSGR